jgi:hypothetical protein
MFLLPGNVCLSSFYRFCCNLQRSHKAALRSRTSLEDGKFSAIAPPPSVAIEKSVLSFTGVVPIAWPSIARGQADPSEEWVFLDSGRTFSPSSEVLLGVRPSAFPPEEDGFSVKW